MNDRQLSNRIRNIMDTFDNGYYSLKDAQNKVNAAFQDRVDSLGHTAPPDIKPWFIADMENIATMDNLHKQTLLDLLTEEDKGKLFSIDEDDRLCTLMDIIQYDDGICEEKINSIRKLSVGEILPGGLSSDIERKV